MNKLNKILLIVIVVIICIASIVIGTLYFVNKNDNQGERIEVTSRTILEKISNQYFIVTKTMVIDQSSTITVDQGSDWSNLLWGQTIEANGLIRLDIGVDLNNLGEEDIEVDRANRKVKIKLPEATILDASQFGDIEVESSKGVLKFLLDNNPNADHNEALSQLIEDAEVAAQNDPKVFEEARTDAIKLIELIVKDLGYSVEITN